MLFRSHREVIRLGTFSEAGIYQVKVNGVAAQFTVGQAPTDEVGSDQATPDTLYRSPDGSLSMSAPSSWNVQASSGSITVAASDSALSPSETPSAARISVTVISGPDRASDFGIDGLTPREAFAMLILTRGLLIGPPQALDGVVWPTLWSHASSEATGDVDLRVLSINAETMVAVMAQSPPGEWDSLQPLFEAMIESIEIH